MKQSIVFLLALGYLLAECCRASLTISYTVDNHDACGTVGGHGSPYSCGGRAQAGTFSGRGSCNIFGCADVYPVIG
ncbi:GL24362 [Drosophila persimilis]|uniref:GL24362 n=1 Tax=Drosophila persimilis TaxID=7234 RepID=B4G5I0_DROPE|nr:GL24362 [Drosophila persimilis]